ncbi:nitrous oxidase accessory protein [Bacillus ectoiniformans]|uniref:right-handed parallel beta-helix repeat-containing protein n=1 Tax=Bacillus ectoiniformans TaxID=1494429 RepID=UPI00195DC2DF|nr:nitrous oxide reductase family maturation protein NosD [Bacillus ectoiniformans]MBM7649774.1 nitrous oxidase accessory protein [Bacillus ectoiniformans]
MKRCFFLLLLLAILPLPVQAESMDLHPGESLQKVLDHAPPYAEINLHPGLYNGSVSIHHPVTLKGKKGAVIVGNKSGHVLSIYSNDVIVQGIEIKNSGLASRDAAILVDSARNVKLYQNILKENHTGIFIKGGGRHSIQHNSIHGRDEHFSKRGNGIYLLATDQNNISNNRLTNVQDGIYVDESNSNQFLKNQVANSRYAMHFMYSKTNEAGYNTFRSNINGFMIMESSDLTIHRNKLEKHTNFRGYGALIYNSQDIDFDQNEITYNRTGLSLQKTENVTVTSNQFNGNTVAFQADKQTTDVSLSNNEFAGNIVQTQVERDRFRLDSGRTGNHWDDYRSYDVTGDGIGDVPYQSSSGFSELINKQPPMQFFFESPAMVLWQSVEKMFPISSGASGIDQFPIAQERQTSHPLIFSPILLIITILFFRWVRKARLSKNL